MQTLNIHKIYIQHDKTSFLMKNLKNNITLYNLNILKFSRIVFLAFREFVHQNLSRIPSYPDDLAEIQ